MCTVIWMNLDDIMPSERSQSQRVTYNKILLHEMSRTDKSTETRAGRQGVGEGNRVCLLRGVGCSCGVIKS